MELVIWYTPKSEKPRPPVEAAFRTLCMHQFKIEAYDALDDLRKRLAEATAATVLIAWNAAPSPYQMMEEIFQDAQLAQVPMVIVAKGLSPADHAFLAEYQNDRAVEVTGTEVEAAAKARDAVVAQRNKNDAVKRQERVRNFFSLIYGAKFAEAQAYLEGHLDNMCPEIDRLFYRAMILKTQKAFDETVAVLLKALKMSGKGQLEPRFLHLIGNVAFLQRDYKRALQFLDAANKLSPRNLRRRLILAQCLQEEGRRPEALKHYAAIYQHCPAYPGVHSRLFDLKVDGAASAEDIGALEPLLGALPDRGLVSVYKKKVDTLADPACRRALLDLVVREFSRRANQRIKEKDFYGALRQYGQAERLIAPDDQQRLASLAYCVARTHFHAADLSDAKAQIQRALSLAAGPNERFENLAKMIDAALKKEATGPGGQRRAS